MAHLYDKAPPAFARDPWAWDYTRDRIEGNTGIPYDMWEGKHFAGAAAMYKNVIKKYGAAIEAGVMTAPRECVDCGNVAQHYADDYVCKDCRDAIQSAGSYEAAAATISNPDSLDAIRESLYKSLGHDKKDVAKGRTKTFGIASEAPGRPAEAQEAFKQAAGEMLGGLGISGVQMVDEDGTVKATIPVAAPAGKVSRNYARMNADKLARSISELDRGEGEAVKKAVAKGESIMDHYEAALRAAQAMGLPS